MAYMQSLSRNLANTRGVRMGYAGEQILKAISLVASNTIYTVPADKIFALHDWGLWAGNNLNKDMRMEIYNAVPVRQAFIMAASSFTNDAGNGGQGNSVLPIELLEGWYVYIFCAAQCNGYIHGVEYDPTIQP